MSTPKVSLTTGVEALRVLWAHRRRGWWTAVVPAPSPELVAWRKQTAYGDSRHPLDRRDLIDYVAWRRRHRKASTWKAWT